MSIVSVRAQSGGSETQIPFLANAWMMPQWFRLWKLGSAQRCDSAMQYSSALAKERTMCGFNLSTSCRKGTKVVAFDFTFANPIGQPHRAYIFLDVSTEVLYLQNVGWVSVPSCLKSGSISAHFVMRRLFDPPRYGTGVF